MKFAHQVGIYFVFVFILVLAGMGLMLNRIFAINVAHQRVNQEWKELQLSINLLEEIDGLKEMTVALSNEQVLDKGYMDRINHLVSVLEEIRNNSVKVEKFEEKSHVLKEEKKYVDIYDEFDAFLKTLISFKLDSAEIKVDVIKSQMLDELAALDLSARKLQNNYMKGMGEAFVFAETAREQILNRTIIVFIIVILLLGVTAVWFVAIIKKNTKVMLEREKGMTIGLLAQSLAHEIRNPLGIIKSATSVIKRKLPVNSEEFEMAGFMTEEVDRINQLIEQLLQFRKENVTEKHLQDPFIILEQVCRLLAGVCEKSSVKIELVNKAPGRQIFCDQIKLKQAFINVILNAIQASSHGDKIEITTQTNAAVYSIIIRDYGIGFNKDALKKAHDPFYTTKDSGLGLGLFIVRNIIDSHGGDIVISPISPRGTMVTINFKLG